MKKLIEWIKKILFLIPDYARLPLTFCLITDLVAYYLPRIIGVNAINDFSIALDGRIPVIPVFSYIYMLAFPYWAVNYILICRQSKALTHRLVFADTFTKIVCLICFIALPSTIAQPMKEEITGAGAWLLKLIYALDEPNCLLPSIHCFVSWLSFRPMLAKEAGSLPKAYVAFSFVFSMLICLSTLFTRQHVLLDWVTGVGVAELGWMLYRILKIDRKLKA